jgi:hypothetical protein
MQYHHLEIMLPDWESILCTLGKYLHLENDTVVVKTKGNS